MIYIMYKKNISSSICNIIIKVTWFSHSLKCVTCLGGS